MIDQNFTTFKEAWAGLGDQFRDLRIFATGLATAMSTTAQVESDFSSINYKRSQYRRSLLNISLESILHAKRHLLLQRIIKRLGARKISSKPRMTDLFLNKLDY